MSVNETVEVRRHQAFLLPGRTAAAIVLASVKGGTLHFKGFGDLCLLVGLLGVCHRVHQHGCSSQESLYLPLCNGQRQAMSSDSFEGWTGTLTTSNIKCYEHTVHSFLCKGFGSPF